MALAEVRAAWQRIANRCFVQEDAKRAPKLACCSSAPPSVKRTEAELPSAGGGGGQEIPATCSVPFNPNPSYSNLCPSSRWWLQMEPNYGYQKGLVADNLNSPEPGTEKNFPWWRTTETEELALLVSQRSHGLVQNCDLPSPQNTCVKKDMDVYIYGSSDDGISTSSPARKLLNAGSHHHLTAHKYTSSSPNAGGVHKKLMISAEVHTIRESPMQERMSEMQTFENGVKNAQLLEALRHSQTRAREAEKAAKQVTAEKQDVLKLVLGQASQLFMYRQWLQLLQQENMCFQLKNHHPVSTVFPVALPWIPRRTGKIMKNKQKYDSRKRNKRSRLHPFDVNKYAVVFAVGMGLVGAGFILGWTMGWLLPAW